jgi:hypothetical protein
MRPIRRLKNLAIREVSGVRAGAGRGVKVMLLKSDGDESAALDALAYSIDSIVGDDSLGDTEKLAKVDESIGQFNEYCAQESEEAMPTTHQDVDANKLWNCFTDMVAKRDGLTKSKAIDRALTDETGRSLFELAKSVLPNAPHMAPYDSYRDNRTIPQSASPQASSRSEWDRYVDGILAARPGITRSGAIDIALRSPDGQRLWQAARANDPNAPRPRIETGPAAIV